MPLSENEQRQLEAIEKALLADDPKFSATLRSTDLKRYQRRRIVRSVLLFIVGLVMLVCTLVSVWLGVAGFLLMFVATISGASALKRLRGPSDPRFGSSAASGGPSIGPRGSTRGATRPGWRDRIEDRFKRRFDDRD